ncbi:MAG: redoxin domain-containing protein [Halobacteriaceae archaeon]
MVEVGDTAPEFSAPLATGDDIGEFSLGDALGGGPIVLAFFPGAFTGVCTDEMCTFRDNLGAFEDVEATVYGVSVDSPFALNEFREQNGLGFDLISDTDTEVMLAYGVRDDDFGPGYAAAKRAVFVLNEEGTVTYRWVTDDPGVEPDYEAVREAAAEAR